MPHPLESEYGLTAVEILDGVSRHFRARVALEGVVSELILRKYYIEPLQQKNAISRFEEPDEDGQPDFFVWKDGRSQPIKIECKNVRDSDEAYRQDGRIVAYKVEVQKTRAARGDASSRFYDVDYFDVLAVCLGKKTRNWKDFLFIRTHNLSRHPAFRAKIGVMQRVPLPTDDLKNTSWSQQLEDILNQF